MEEIHLKLETPGFEPDLVENRTLPAMCGFEERPGVRYRFTFSNGFGASVIKHSGSYGYEYDLWEIGLLHFNVKSNFWEYDDSHAITDYDVLGYLTDEDATNLLSQIRDGRLNECFKNSWRCAVRRRQK